MSGAGHLDDLNPEQLRAVTTLEGPLLILAGAGSGKTRVLTRRIAHLLHEGVSPARVFAVTFTNKAAAEMKERVAALVGDAGRKVWVSTFHSSCVRILRQDIEPLGWTPRFAIYDDDDQLRLLKEIVRSHGYDPEKYPPRKLAGRIDFYKNRMMDVDQLLAQRRAQANEPLVRVWRDYEEALAAADALDFNDLIGHAVRLFREHPEALEKWRGRFHYLLVDEYQDTNSGQYQLLRLLAAQHRNLAVVGDDDQSIYGFRGADIGNILGFEKDFPDAVVIRLEQNYRSTGNILTVANSVIAKNTERKDKALWTSAGEGRPVRLVCRANPPDEARWVARAILQLRRQGLDWQDMAIVYRTNATSRLFERELSRNSVPHRIVGGLRFYQRREVRDILAYLRLLVSPADDAALLRVLNVPSRGIGAKTLAQLREDAAQRGEPLLTAARNPSFTGRRAVAALRSFVTLIDELEEVARVTPPAQLVREVIIRSGYKAMLDAEATRESLGRQENLQELVHDAVQFEYPDDAMSPRDQLRAWLDRVTLSGQDEEFPDGGQVTLLTVHNAKGLEYPAVFVVHMLEGQFPHARSSGDQGGVEEERRLAYVAFTRARRLLLISWNRDGTGIEYLSRGGRPSSAAPAKPSRFILDLPADAIEGDIPSLEPAMSPHTTDGPGALRERFGTFVANHRARSAAAATDAEIRLRDIEDVEQLSPGRRVHHARYGVGQVARRSGLRLLVAFSGSQQRWVPLQGGELQLVDD